MFVIIRDNLRYFSIQLRKILLLGINRDVQKTQSIIMWLNLTLIKNYYFFIVVWLN